MNALTHFAINADDVARAKRFYENVFGWTFNAFGPADFYQIEGEPRGALQARRELAPGTPTLGFECTFGVESLDVVEEAVLREGGEVAMARSRIEGVGSLMFFRDTEGNVFGAMQYVDR